MPTGKEFGERPRPSSITYLDRYPPRQRPEIKMGEVHLWICNICPPHAWNLPGETPGFEAHQAFGEHNRKIHDVLDTNAHPIQAYVPGNLLERNQPEKPVSGQPKKR